MIHIYLFFNFTSREKIRICPAYRSGISEGENRQNRNKEHTPPLVQMKETISKHTGKTISPDRQKIIENRRLYRQTF